MNSPNPLSLRHRNSFAVESIAKDIITISSLAQLEQVSAQIAAPFYILGDGTNSLFVEDVAPLIIDVQLKGVSVTEDNEAYYLDVAAAENWHQLVESTVNQHMPGLENLALIPGTVGAAPVQNIGAYGVEFSQFCTAVHWYDFTTRQLQWLSKSDCHFGYRDSIFKRQLKNKGLIVAVKLRLPKRWQGVLTYAGLDALPATATAQQIMASVIAIRSSKLPDYRQLPNAGSFFKNPVIARASYQALQQQYPGMPAYEQEDGRVKLAAGWLIEQAGLKGYRDGDVGVHEKQALVLVNYGSQHGASVLTLAQKVRQVVQDKFGVLLEPEVRLVSGQGEIYLTKECKHG